MQVILFEDESRYDLLPLTFTRPAYDLRVGIDKLSEKWSSLLEQPVGTFAYDYLGDRFSKFDMTQESIWVNGKFIPNSDFVKSIRAGLDNACSLITDEGEVVAFQCHPSMLGDDFKGMVTQQFLYDAGLKARLFKEDLPNAIRFPWDIYRLNGETIQEDFKRITAGRTSQPIDDPHTIVYGKDNIFVEEGVKIRAAVLNAEDGPIYLGKGADIQEGAMVHGTHAICEHATLSMGAKMRGDTTVGPWSKVGGEVGNSVIQGYSNKGHDGYMGNSVLGHWCNIGADTNTSNLKNNYAEVRLWNYRTQGFAKTGQQFCGLIMGDHSKCGINTMFNTGTVVGVSANIFGAGYPRNIVPSFSWGGAAGLSTYRLKKVFEVAELVMMRRKKACDDQEKAILERVFADTAEYRRWEK